MLPTPLGSRPGLTRPGHRHPSQWAACKQPQEEARCSAWNSGWPALCQPPPHLLLAESGILWTLQVAAAGGHPEVLQAHREGAWPAGAFGEHQPASRKALLPCPRQSQVGGAPGVAAAWAAGGPAPARPCSAAWSHGGRAGRMGGIWLRTEDGTFPAFQTPSQQPLHPHPLVATATSSVTLTGADTVPVRLQSPPSPRCQPGCSEPAWPAEGSGGLALSRAGWVDLAGPGPCISGSPRVPQRLEAGALGRAAGGAQPLGGMFIPPCLGVHPRSC